MHRSEVRICEYCGKEFIATTQWKSQRYCNRQCSAKGRENKPDPYTVETLCKCGCGEIIMNPDDHYRYRKFIASHRNSNGTHPRLGVVEDPDHVAWRVAKSFAAVSKKETCLETQLYEYLDCVGIPYEKQMQIGTTKPDAYIPSLELCIYADGTYWHTKEKDVLRDNRSNACVISKGFMYLRLNCVDIGYILNLRPLQQYLLQNYKFSDN
jgi:very-short-patch-repair endonuclease